MDKYGNLSYQGTIYSLLVQFQYVRVVDSIKINIRYHATGKMERLGKGIKSYFEDSTVHGFRYVATGSNAAVRFVWICLIIGTVVP